jgi:uncharacterized protein (DUF58 family)
VKPSPVVLNKLARSKLRTRWAAASTGIGERRSRDKGSGMEFADHREYQPGDDIRHLDPHIYARFGQNYVRQYEVYKQLPVTILIDASRSMNFGEPNKYQYALLLAALLGFVGLAGSDQVQLATGTGGKIHRSPRYHGIMRAQQMFDWLDAQKTEPSGTFGETLRGVTNTLVGRGLLIILSDWWEEDLEAELGILVATGQEVWGIQVVAPEEIEPGLWGEGEVRFVDVESGHEVELAVDRMTLDRYRRSFAAWRDQIQSVLSRSHGRYLLVSTDRDPERLVQEDWRRLGMLD